MIQCSGNCSMWVHRACDPLLHDESTYKKYE